LFSSILFVFFFVRSFQVNNCGMLAHAQGRSAEAEPLLREALAGRQSALGRCHPDTLFSTFCLGAVLRAQASPPGDGTGTGSRGTSKAAEAEAVVVMAVQEYRLALGDHHPLTKRAVNLLANFLHRGGAGPRLAALPDAPPPPRAEAAAGAPTPRRSHGASAGSIDWHTSLPKHGGDGAPHYSKSSSWIGQRGRHRSVEGGESDDDDEHDDEHDGEHEGDDDASVGSQEGD
jgi:hypothetical protein